MAVTVQLVVGRSEVEYIENGPQYAALRYAGRDGKGEGCAIFDPCMKGAGAEVGSHEVVTERKYVLDFV
jgi:hypothetical protein